MSNKTLVRFGEHYGICVDAIIFWEMRRGGSLDVYVAGLPDPFVFGGDEASALAKLLNDRSLNLTPVKEDNQ